MIDASRELLAPREDVWALVAEPYHLPDWWPAYAGVRPDRRGLSEGARWHVMRGRSPGLLRRPSSEGLIVIRRVVAGRELAWRDLAQEIDAEIVLTDEGATRTRARVAVSGAWWRLLAEGTRGLPKQALARLHALCQTAAEL